VSLPTAKDKANVQQQPAFYLVAEIFGVALLCYKRQFQNKAQNQTGKHQHTLQRQPTPKPGKARKANHKSKSPGLLIHIGDIRRQPSQPMLDGKANGFHEEASHTTLQHRIVPAESHAEFPQHSLNKLLFGEEALTPISS
jgi:hypothetical protein